MKPRLLDLCCCAGGAGMGYSLAGFDVKGVDIDPQPRYPFRFKQWDALDYLKRHGPKFDAIHASPPCQRFTVGAAQMGTQDDHPDLLTPILDLLEDMDVPFVVENVLPAATRYRMMRADIVLCGTMFGLGVFRHRAFHSNVALTAPPHYKHQGRIGDGKYQTVAGNTGGSSTRDGTVWGGAAEWKAAMGIDWMTVDELREAIPPAYTRHIGEQLMAVI